MDEFVCITRKTSGFTPFPKDFLKDGIEIKTFSIQEKDDVYQCFYDAFLHRKDRSFLGRTEEQRRVMFDGYFDDPDNLNKEASLTLSKMDQVIGFCVFKSRPYVGDEHLVLLCVHPDHQGEGLEKQLLSLSISKIYQPRDKLISLGVDLNNIAAYKLYQKLGFKTQTKFITYVFENEVLS